MTYKMIIGFSLIVILVLVLYIYNNLKHSRLLHQLMIDTDEYFGKFNALQNEIIKAIVDTKDEEKRNCYNDLLDKLLDFNQSYINLSSYLVRDIQLFIWFKNQAEIQKYRDAFNNDLKSIHKLYKEDELHKSACKVSEYGNHILTELYEEYLSTL